MWGVSFIIRGLSFSGQDVPERHCVFYEHRAGKSGRDGLKEQNAMRKVLVTFVLALTTAAMAQGSAPTQPQQPAPGAPAASQPAQPGAADQANTPTSQKVIKDPAE